MARYRETPAFIYFARPIGEIGPIKIGSSLYPKTRVKRVGAEVGKTLEIAAKGRGDYAMEQDLHGYFNRHWIEGEWFSPDDEILRLIKRLNAGRSLRTLMQRMHGTQLWSEYSHRKAMREFAGMTLGFPTSRETA